MAARNAYPSDVRERFLEYRASWRANAVSTDLADRPTAEAAFRRMYQAHGLAEPQVLWVASPAAGRRAAAIAAHARQWVRGTFTRGEVGTGYNQDRRALAEPFDLEPTWRRRLATRAAEHLHEATGFGSRSSWDPLAGLVGALELDDVTRIDGLVRARLRWNVPSETGGDPSPIDPAVVDATAPGILGAMWSSAVEAVGIDIAREVVALAIQRAARTLIADSSTTREAELAMQPGQFDVVAPALAVERDVLGRRLYGRRTGGDCHEGTIDARLDLARSAGPWWALKGLVIVSERPLTASLDDRGRLHGEAGPALAWGDGMAVWAWHGVAVDQSTVLKPRAITVAMIDGESNIERRRVLIERFGEERLMREGGAKLVDQDATGRLWRREMPNAWPRDEAVVMVEVLNSTPEPDGTRKTYFLRVPPTSRSARAAVAWTFGLDGDLYRPAIET